MSQMHSSSEESDNEVEGADLFKCPICYDYIFPPIYQCENGHLVCNNCKPNFFSCPSCRGRLGNYRNLALEKVANRMTYPCKYSKKGCNAVIKFIEKPDHQKICNFRPYNCIFSECEWRGSLQNISLHIRSSHRNIAKLQSDNVVFLATDINLPGNIDWIMMQSCFNHQFILVLQKKINPRGNHQYFVYVQLIGSQEQAENFSYRLEFTKSKNRLSWEAITKSIRENVDCNKPASDCFCFDQSFVQRLSENENLSIGVRIFNK